MADYYIAAQRYVNQGQNPANTSVFWNKLGGDESGGTTKALLSESGADTGHTLVFVANPHGGTSNVNSTANGDTSADAAWVDEAVIVNNAINVRLESTSVRLTGFAPGETRIIEALSYQTLSSSRELFLSVNGASAIQVPSFDNLSEVGRVEAEADESGEFLIALTGNSTTNSYVQALRAIDPPAPTPALTITNEGDITPGTTLTAVASNYSEAPTAASITDSQANEIMPTPTVTADGDDYNVSVSIADFLEAAKSTPTSGLLPGPCTLEVS